MLKDYFGNELNIGDEVAFMRVNYRSLMKGTIISMAEKTVLLSHEEIRIRKTRRTKKTKTRQYADQVIKKV